MTPPAILPPAVKPGDTVAIVSTSSPVPAGDLQRLVGYFDKRGHPVRVTANTATATGYLAGTAHNRAADLMSAFTDPDVTLIVPATGGKGAAHLLDLLDYDVIAAHPTVFTALSDPAILANAITTRTGLATLHGPTGYDFSREDVDAFTENGFWQAVTGPIAGNSVTGDDWRVPRGAGAWVSGPVFGGHLGTIRALVGTPHLPALDGAILVIEEAFVPWVRLDVALTHLRLAGVLDQLAALIVGAPLDCPRDDAPDNSWDELILRCVPGTFPVLTNVELGHTPRKSPLPIGQRVELNLTTPVPALTYLEDLVAL